MCSLLISSQALLRPMRRPCDTTCDHQPHTCTHICPLYFSINYPSQGNRRLCFKQIRNKTARWDEKYNITEKSAEKSIMAFMFTASTLRYTAARMPWAAFPFLPRTCPLRAARIVWLHGLASIISPPPPIQESTPQLSEFPEPGSVSPLRCLRYSNTEENCL